VALNRNHRKRNHLITIPACSLQIHFNIITAAALQRPDLCYCALLMWWKRFCLHHVRYCVSWRLFIMQKWKECWRPYFWYRSKVWPICFTRRCKTYWSLGAL